VFVTQGNDAGHAPLILMGPLFASALWVLSVCATIAQERQPSRRRGKLHCLLLAVQQSRPNYAATPRKTYRWATVSRRPMTPLRNNVRSRGENKTTRPEGHAVFLNTELVNVVDNAATAWVNEVNTAVGVVVAIAPHRWSPISRDLTKLNIGWHRGAYLR
jgi:hypothetical protein